MSCVPVTLMVHPPVYREGCLVDRDDPLPKEAGAAAQPAGKDPPTDVVAGAVLVHLSRLLWVIPITLIVCDLLDCPN